MRAGLRKLRDWRTSGKRRRTLIRRNETPVLAQAGLHAVKGVHVAIAPSYLRSPYPPQFAPQYPEPPFGPPAFTGYDLRYPAAPYVYQYTYQYPYYVYYVVPWPRWPAGY